MLYELIYMSHSVPAAIAQRELENILCTSRRFNADREITGVLLHENGHFVQLLEGERETVRDLYYERILRDPRHRDARVVLEHDIAARSFRDWNMGFVRLNDLEPSVELNLDGFLEGGVAALEMDDEQSYGRRLLLALYSQMQAGDRWRRVFARGAFPSPAAR